MFLKLKSKIKEFGKLTPMAMVSAFLPILGTATLFVFVYPVGHWLRENWEAGIPIFISSVIFFCGLALLPTNVIGVLSGWAFSFELGVLVLMTGIVGSSFVSFLINRRISGKKVPELTEKHPKAQAIYNSLVKDGFWKATLIIFLLRMSIIMPFALTNFLMASARVPLKSYLLGTAAGMLPRSSAMVFVGAGLSELNVENTRDVTFIVIGIIATFISIAVIAMISRKALEKLTLEHLETKSA